MNQFSVDGLIHTKKISPLRLGERVSTDGIQEGLSRIPKSVERASILHQPDGVGSKMYHIVPHGELNGIPITLVARQHSELLAKFQAQEVEIIRLKERDKVLEDKDGDKSGDDAPIKGRSNNEGEAPAERISNDSEDIARVLTSLDAATVLAGEANVPTGSGFIPTAGPPTNIVSTGSEVGPTASPIVQRRKGKEIMEESDTPKRKKLQEQIDAQVAKELE
nr:hypothetical protein [Tanacetum cinerariifolium]